MENCKRKSRIEKHFLLVWTCRLLVLSILCHYPIVAHFIQIDHNEFRASGFPRPVIPPHLPPLDQLPQHLPAKDLTPVEIMVDLTNDLTYRILHYHSILNRNNFAFSPTALVSILVALYEGSAGRSAMELKNVLQFPNNKDVLRVGYRDIHRRLRTYFFDSENPLKGLSLNKDNVTITREFENILMFYGYDLGMDMVSSVAPTTTESTTNTVMTEPATTLPPTNQEETTEIPSTVKETTTLPVTEEPTLETANEKDETTTIESMTVETTTKDTTTTTTKITTSTTTTTEKPTTTTTTTTTTQAPDSTTTETPKTTTEEPTTVESETETQSETEMETEVETVAPTTTESETEEGATTGNEAAELISSSTGEPFLRLQKPRVARLPSGRLQAPPRPQTSARTLAQTRTQPTKLTRLVEPQPKTNYLPATSRTFQSERTSIRQGRQKRHLLGTFKEADANLFVTLFQPPSPHHNLYTVSGPASGPALTHVANEFEVEIEPHFITGPSGQGGGPVETKQNYNTDIISHIFYLGSQEVIYTTYKVYNAVLYYKYFEHLKMNVLELELDTPEYNLMILLPDHRSDLVTAASSLRLGPTLRILRKQLKPRWVQAIIPDFKLHGTMFLTNDLQNLGICDIFEPNRADFRPMTDEKGIYVKHIEQSINVNIRTHPINQLRRNYGAAQLHPIQISVNHPFLFFIIDRDLDVAVMSGRILNPLNVRIQ